MESVGFTNQIGMSLSMGNYFHYQNATLPLDPGRRSSLPAIKHSTAAASHSFQRRGRGRSILTKEHAQIIFKLKPSCSISEKGNVQALANTYGVSAKTVRDIWIGRTWYKVTYELDKGKPIASERLLKKPGRPKGSKDFKPRSKKMLQTEPESREHQYTQFTVHRPVLTAVSSANNAIASLGRKKSENTELLLSNKSETLNSPPQESLAVDVCSRTNSPRQPHVDGLGAVPEFKDPVHDDWRFGRSSSGIQGSVPQRLFPWTELFQNSRICSTTTGPLDEALPEFKDPFHDDWLFWPRENDGPPDAT